jgi:predicted ATPase
MVVLLHVETLTSIAGRSKTLIHVNPIEAKAWHRATMTNWHVITGGPSSGKTTTVQMLGRRGYRTTIEHARHFIDTQRITGRTVAEIRANQREFQKGVVMMQIEQEQVLDPDELYFLDRALPDSLAYCRYLGIEPDPELLAALGTASYRKVFVLDLLPLAGDYARTEDAAAQLRIHATLIEVYEDLGFVVETVPVLSVEQRVDLILSRVDRLPQLV